MTEEVFIPPVGTLVLCDTQQLFFGCRDAYGPTMRTDFKKLKELIDAQLADDPPNSWADYQAYVMAYQNYNVTNFTSMLKHFNYSIKKKDVATYESGRNTKEHSCSTEIIADAVIKQDRYQRFIFITGEGGILHAVRTLKASNKTIWVVAFPGSLNQSLAAEVDRTLLLSENIVWTPERERTMAAQRQAATVNE